MQDRRAGLYSCFNLTLRSELALEELHPAETFSVAAAVDIRRGRVPETLPGAAPVAFGVQVAGGAAVLSVPGVARYLVNAGREIVVDAAEGAPPRAIRLYLLGSALGLLCHQRGLLLLHANALVAGGVAVAFAGRSGAGKSTLAGHFERAGYEVLCDDVCAVAFDESGTPVAWPGLPRLKLWGEAARAFGHDPEALAVAIEGLDKYHVPMARRGAIRPVRFARLYVLDRASEGETPAIERLRGGAAMSAVMGNTYRGEYLAPMGLARRHFEQCAALAARIEVYRASRIWGYDVFGQQAALLERHVADAG